MGVFRVKFRDLRRRDWCGDHLGEVQELVVEAGANSLVTAGRLEFEGRK